MTTIAPTSPRALVARYFRIWNDGDPTQLVDVLAPGWVDHAHPERSSAADVGEAILRARIAEPELRVYVDAVLGDDSLVTVNGRVRTAEGTENRVWIVRVEADRMKEMWTYSAD